MRCDISNQLRLPALWPSSRDICRRCVARGSSVRYTRWPKPGIFSFRASFARTISSTFSVGRVLPDLEQQAHHVGVGAAVERPLERADRADDRRMHVGQRGRRHTRREGGRVELVVGVQHQRDVERPRRQPTRPLARQHVEEIRGVAERRIGLDRRPLRPPAGRTSPRPCPAAPSDVTLCDSSPRPTCRPHPDRNARAPRRACAASPSPFDRRQRPHEAQHAFGQPARRRQLRLQIAQLGPIRQPSVPQQIADFLERRVVGRDRGCRSRDTPARRGRHPGSRWTRSPRRCLRDPLWQECRRPLRG